MQHAKNQNNMPTTIEQLELELQELKSELLTLKQNERNKLKIEYDKAYNSLRKAIIGTGDIQNSIQRTYEKLGLTNLFSDNSGETEPPFRLKLRHPFLRFAMLI